VGPSGVGNVPRPRIIAHNGHQRAKAKTPCALKEERGGCDCEVCAGNRGCGREEPRELAEALLLHRTTSCLQRRRIIFV